MLATSIEGNEVYNCEVGVYHDTWSTTSLLIKSNLFRNVNTGIQQNIPGKYNVGELTISNNTFELGRHLHPDGHHAPKGVLLDGNCNNTDTFQNVYINSNVIKNADALYDPVTDPMYGSFGVFFNSCNNIKISDNTIELNSPKLIMYTNSNIVDCVNNTNSSGVITPIKY